jgi:RNA polymerase sigma factor (sigma-70 family)
MGTVLQYLRRLTARQHDDELPDEQLLERFARQRDELAFAALLRRHGSMVLGVCRGILRHTHDVEDAFQATFLILAQKAASIRQRHSLGGWLYGVAYRVAVKASARAARRRQVERRTPDRVAADPLDDLTVRELRQALHEELRRLPEKYRTPLVLCYLQGKTQEEAARQLGWPKRRVKDRLQRGKERLHRRLSQRGLAPVAVLGTVLFAEGTVPAALAGATLRSALHSAPLAPAVAGLVEAAGTMASFGKAKMATVILLAASLLSGAGVWVCRGSLAPAVPPPAERREQPHPSAKPEAKETVVVRGRVLDPDGKPIKEARLYWPRVPKSEPRTAEDVENIDIAERAKSDAEGRFRFELPRSDIHPEWAKNICLIAAAAGYGVDGIELPKEGPVPEVTLRLVKDQPIEGRIISTEGKPLAAVNVRIMGVGKTRQERLDDFLAAWKRKDRRGPDQAFGQLSQQMFLPHNNKSYQTVTDKDGRFRLQGAGVERLVLVRLRAPGLTPAPLLVINRAGFDPAEWNKAARDNVPPAERRPDQPPLLYGPKIEYVAPASRRIEGTVREATSGKAVPGYRLFMRAPNGFDINSISDKEGKYKLLGVPKMKQYMLFALPPADSAWLPTAANAADAEALRTIKVDFTVARGVLVSGRILDRATGKGVRAAVRFVPLPGNKFFGKPGYDYYKHAQQETKMTEIREPGRYQLAVMPGPGVLMVQSRDAEKANGGQQVNPYKQPEFDAKDREHVKIGESNGQRSFLTALENHSEYLSIQNAVKYLDLAADAGSAKCDLFLERGTTRSIKMEDPEGKPLMGTIISGVTATGWTTFTIKDASCTIFALDPKKPRRLMFYHAPRKLAGTLTVRGDEKEPPVARLRPTGAVTGRVVDRAGKPLAGAYILLSTLDDAVREINAQLKQRGAVEVQTDKEGRFRIEGIVPETKFRLAFVNGRAFVVADPPIDAKQVKPGETLDLGDVRVKPAR